MEKRLNPPAAHQSSVSRLSRAWYVVCRSKKLRKKPRAVTLLGLPLVLFRDAEGAPRALLDRCAHRNVPLSEGQVLADGCLQCPYHGWRFAGDGRCTEVPGLCDEASSERRAVPSYPARDHDGYIWIHPEAEEPSVEPFVFPLRGERGYSIVRRELTVEASLHAFAENALDVPHTAFLHKGLFRGASEPNLIEVDVTRGPDRVEAEYIGEPRPEGLAARILSPSGGVVTHFDRFILPCVIQVEYRIGEENHILVSAFCTPEEDHRTRIFAEVAFRVRLPHWLLKPFILPIALRIFKQDADILARQSANIQRFGGEAYTSTELDVLGPQILRLLRGAERGREAGEPYHKRLKMLV